MTPGQKRRAERLAQQLDNPVPIFEHHGPTENVERPKLRLVRWIQENEWIRDKHAQIVKFILKAAQKRLIALVVMVLYLRIYCEFIILKSRQLGFSTEIEGIVFALVHNIPNTEALLAAHQKDNTKKIFRITRRFYKRYPEAEEMGAKFNRECLEYPDEHGSRIDIVTAETEDSGASGTTNLGHLSEFGLFKKPEGFWQGFHPAMAKTPGALLFVESTGRPDAHDYKSLWDSSFKHDRQHPIKTYLYLMDCIAKGINPRIGIFESWTEDPEARIPLLPGEELELNDQEKALQTEFNLDLEQMKYWQQVWKTWFKGNWALALVEFPLKPDHPFQYYGGPAYDQEILSRLRASATPPVFRGEITCDTKSMFVKPILEPSEFGKLRIWEHPIIGELYVVSLDSAQGTGVGDFNEIVVAKVGRGDCKHKVVAHFRTNERHFGPGTNAAMSWFLGMYYNQGLIISERNAINQAAIEKLVEGHPGYPQTITSAPYPFLFSYTQKDRDTQEEREEYGFQSTGASVQAAIADLAESIHADLWEIDSVELIDQLMGYCEDPLKRGRNKFEQTYKDPVTGKLLDDGCDAMRVVEHGVRWVIDNDIPSLRRVE